MSTNKKTKADSLKFDYSEFKEQIVLLKKKHKAGKVSITLPDNISFKFTPTEEEKKIAKEIYGNTHNSRVLNPRLCEYQRVENAVIGFNEVRKKLQDIQVKLDNIESPLFFLLEYAISGVKQLRSFDEQLDSKVDWDKYMDLFNLLRDHLVNIFAAINSIAGIKATYDFPYKHLSSPVEFEHIELAKKYNDEKKIEKLYEALKGEFIQCTPQDFRELFGGGKANTIIWPGNQTDLIFFIVLLYALTFENPEEFKKTGTNISPYEYINISKRFDVKGTDAVKYKSIGPMISAHKKIIVDSGNSTGGDYKNSNNASKLIHKIKEAFEINELFPIG